MAAKKKTTKRPSVRATKAAEHLLEVPELMAALSSQMDLMAMQLGRMEHSIRVLHALVMAPSLEKPRLLTEPAPTPDAALLNEFKNEPKGNIP